jgi:arylsulfatase A-like enzyme/Tfp pilus assembly protein PilF
MTRRLVPLLICTLAACRPAADVAPAARPNILLVTVDTMRADRLGRGFTPVLDQLAAQGLRFTEARSVVPLTLPAHASIMTGQLPPSHGIRINGAARLQNTPTVAMLLKSAGYQTRAAVGAFVLDRRFGLDAGFDEYDDQIARNPDAMDLLQAERTAGDVIDRAARMLAGLQDAPWMMWVHVYDPHAPYSPPAAALARAKGNAYDGEIAYVDEQVGRLLTIVSSRGDAARTAVIVSADHGESLGAHGEPTHGMLIFEPVIRVPLIVTAPGVQPAVRDDAASIVDIAPTVLALAGLPATGAGRNLIGLPPAEGAESYAESEYPRVAAWAPARSLVRDGWKMIVSDRPVLFNLGDDPEEQRDLAAAQPALVTAMAARLDTLRAATASSSSNAVSPETASRLRSLGYVAASLAPAPAAGGVNAADAMPAWSAFESALSDVTAGHIARALPALAKVSTAYPDSPIFAATYARALAASGQKTQAIAQFRDAVKRWATDWSLYHELAVVARDLGRADEAQRAEAAALALNPREPSVLNGTGLLMSDAGRDREASQAFESALQYDPTNAVYAANLGNSRRALGDLDGAAAAYRRALDRAPLPDAANGLGVVLVQQRQFAAALPWLQQAARDPEFIEAQLNLGIALQEAGEIAGARQQYLKVIAAGSKHARERDAARALLAQLGPR